MKKLKQLIISFLLAVLTLNIGMVGLGQSAKAATTINASAAMIVDAKTGQVIYGQNTSKRLPIASITKLLTVAVIMDEINHNKLSWNTKVKVDKGTAKVAANTEYSNVPLEKGQSYTVKQLVHAVLIKSADGAALALSTTNGDTTASFNKKMQQMAKKMGIKDAKIYNAAGLSNGDVGSFKLKNVSKKAENSMSANDIAKMSQYLINNYPEILKITKTKSETFKSSNTSSTTMDNLNEMLPGNEDAPTKVTMDGLKTGSSDAAGNSFVGTGSYQGHRFITVVLHANGQNGTDARYSETIKLITMVYTDYTQATIKKGDEINNLDVVSVPNGKTKTVSVRAASDTNLWLPKGTKLSDLKHAVTIKKSLQTKDKELSAPVKAGQTIGTATLTGNNIASLNGKNVKIELAAQKSVEKANVFVRFARTIAGFFTSGTIVHADSTAANQVASPKKSSFADIYVDTQTANARVAVNQQAKLAQKLIKNYAGSSVQSGNTFDSKIHSNVGANVNKDMA